MIFSPSGYVTPFRLLQVPKSSTPGLTLGEVDGFGLSLATGPPAAESQG
jgi:hypothetical protein